MNEQEFNKLREKSWRQPLNAIEEAQLQAYLNNNPEAHAAWEQEGALTHLINQLPDLPPPSNFTAQVLAQLDRPSTQPNSASALWTSLIGRLKTIPIPRLAWAAMALVAAGLAYEGYHWQQQQQQAELERGVALLLSAMPAEPAVFEDFEAVQRLGRTPSVVDEELWAALNR